ncbi:MAG: hypothetical protein ACK412_03755 [Chloroherpetonaceae bacterium]
MKIHQWLLAWFALLLCVSTTRAQFLGNDDLQSVDEEFIDHDSTTVYYLRYSLGYSTISTLNEFRLVVSRTFEKRFGASSIRYSNAIAEGVPIGVSFFRKQNRLFAWGINACFSPIIRTSYKQNNEPSPVLPSSTITISSNAFFQSISLEAVGECRFKLLLLDFGIGVQTQRIGDKVQTTIYNEIAEPVRVESIERRAWIFSPTYFFAIGLDFFSTERFSVVPMYKSFYWHYGNVKGSSDVFLFSLRTNL